MQLHIEPKEIRDAYSTPIVQQTSFGSKVKERSGITSRAFEFAVRNYPLEEDKYNYFTAREMNMQGYYQ